MIEGYIGLFISAFLAATVLPLSSEALLLGMAASGDYLPLTLFLVASGGNVLGSVLNWVLGRFCLRWRGRRWFPVKPPALEKATGWYNRYGVWTLLLAWLPIVGDPLTLAAGILRVPFWMFLILVTIGKAGRYALLLHLLEIF